MKMERLRYVTGKNWGLRLRGWNYPGVYSECGRLYWESGRYYLPLKTFSLQPIYLMR